MCEMLVRVVDKRLPLDQGADVTLSKRGDVIVVVPDGWKWSKGELANPDWRILKWPHVSIDEASVLMSPEIAHAKPLSASISNMPRLLLQHRGFRLDLNKLPNDKVSKSVTIDSVKIKSEIVIDNQVIG